MEQKDKRMFEEQFIPFVTSKIHKNYYAAGEIIIYNDRKIKMPVSVLIDSSKKNKDKINIHTIDNMIGKGSFGRVFESNYKISTTVNGKKIAIKKHDKEKRKVIKVQDKDSGIRNEVALLKRIKAFGVKDVIFQDNICVEPRSNIEYVVNNNYVLMNRLPGETLDKIIDRLSTEPDYLSDEKRWDIIQALLVALQQITDKRIIHRDIKPQNIMVSIDPVVAVNIIDFGLSIDFNNQKERKKDAGSFTYFAPEVLNIINRVSNNDVSDKTDVFAMGLCIAEFLGAKLTTKHHSLLLDLKKYGMNTSEPISLIAALPAEERITGYDESNPIFNDLIFKMLSNNPKSRLSIDNAIKTFSKIRSDLQSAPPKLLADDISINKRNQPAVIQEQPVAAREIGILTTMGKDSKSASTLGFFNPSPLKRPRLTQSQSSKIDILAKKLDGETNNFFANKSLKNAKASGLRLLKKSLEDNKSQTTAHIIKSAIDNNKLLTKGYFSRTKKLLNEMLKEEQAGEKEVSPSPSSSS